MGEATGGDQGKTGEIVPNGKEVSLDGLGIHPSEAIGGGGDVLEEVRHQVAAEYLPVMATIRDELIEELKEIEGAEVRALPVLAFGFVCGFVCLFVRALASPTFHHRVSDWRFWCT